MGATSAMTPPLLRNLITAIFTISDKSLHTLSTHSNLLKFIRRFLTPFFLYFLSSFIPNPSTNNDTHLFKNPKAESFSNNNNDSGLARALSQLLTIVNDVPVSSRKYEIVRSLAERIVDDNNREGFESLREVNRRALTTSFEQTLRRLENAAVAEERGDLGFGVLHADFHYLSRALKVLRYVGDVAWARFVNFKPVVVTEEAAAAVGPGGGLGEKLAAEVLWLAQKLAACGYVEEAVDKWASASTLAWLALRVEPRLQGAMVKVSAFLFKQAAEIGRNCEAMDEEWMMKHKVMKMKMLLSWLPLLCRASNGVDAPVLSAMERGELERILEEMIDGLDCMEDREKVLSLWLHHFTYCPSSDWPNLRECYARWCNESRKQMLLQ